ncbi:hypothetical protein QYF36_009170 [Acer negundo]|nr:hypothetical protein QYF36_009170 [Acer negundo]
MSFLGTYGKLIYIQTQACTHTVITCWLLLLQSSVLHRIAVRSKEWLLPPQKFSDKFAVLGEDGTIILLRMVPLFYCEVWFWVMEEVLLESHLEHFLSF